MRKLDVLYESVVEGDVWEELFSLKKEITNFMKRFGIGYNIKTFDEEKGAVAKTRSILQNILMRDDVGSAREIEQSLKQKVVKYRDGQPNFKDWEVERVARTEAKAMSIATKLLKWKKMGIERVRHKARNDNKVGEDSLAFNDSVFSIDFLLENSQYRLPLRPNDRCTYIPTKNPIHIKAEAHTWAKKFEKYKK